jgi:hypothetical protein
MPATLPIMGCPICVVQESSGMSSSLYHNKSRRPSMEKVESIVADMEEVYQRVVPKSKENSEYKIECRKSSTPAAKSGHHLGT